MPTGLAILILVLFLIIVLLLFVTILVAPGRYTQDMVAPFKNRYFAHRGLHTKDKKIPENTIAAFDAACKAGYGIELDVRITSDGQVVISHDDNVERVTGVDFSIENNTFEELSKLRVHGSDQSIPLLMDALGVIDGRVPVIIEIKTGKNNLLLCNALLKILAPYEGVYALESFDPSIVKWVKGNMPWVLRGQLASRMDFYNRDEVPAFAAFFMSRCLSGLMNRPHFIAYEVGPKPWPVKLTKLLGAMHVTWTSRPKEMGGDPETDARENDVVIFEFYEPPTHY